MKEKRKKGWKEERGKEKGRMEEGRTKMAKQINKQTCSI